MNVGYSMRKLYCFQIKSCREKKVLEENTKPPERSIVARPHEYACLSLLHGSNEYACLITYIISSVVLRTASKAHISFRIYCIWGEKIL